MAGTANDDPDGLRRPGTTEDSDSSGQSYREISPSCLEQRKLW
jgi:hypothetical protein